LRVPAGDAVLSLRWVLHSSGSPIAAVESFHPATDPTGVGIIGGCETALHLGADESPVRTRNVRISVAAARADDAELLGIGAGEPVLVSAITCLDATGDAVRFERRRYRPDHIALLVVETN